MTHGKAEPFRTSGGRAAGQNGEMTKAALPAAAKMDVCCWAARRQRCRASTQRVNMMSRDSSLASSIGKRSSTVVLFKKVTSCSDCPPRVYIQTDTRSRASFSSKLYITNHKLSLMSLDKLWATRYCKRT